MARSKIETTTHGHTLLDGKLVGKRKFLVKGQFHVEMDEELLLIAHDSESAEERFTQFASRKAEQLGGKLDTVFIDFAEDAEYFDGKR
tara:strand:- start:840 stop:1103 length:264 start_codon:yes stop_codon:yes gene_type:complete